MVASDARRSSPRAMLTAALMLALSPAGASLLAQAPDAPAIRQIDPAEAARVSFVRDIRPILDDKCLECHDAVARTSDFEVTSYAALLKAGSKAGPGVVPGKPDESAVVQYIRGERQPRMPKGYPPLSDDQLHLIRMWIQEGALDDSATAVAGNATRNDPGAAFDPQAIAPNAVDPQSRDLLNAALFADDAEQVLLMRRTLRLARLPAVPAPPRVHPASDNPIDQFIHAKWKSAGLPEAQRLPALTDDAAFLRRVYLDVIGVIPTAEEARRFLSDKAPDKRTRLIDALLARNEDYAAHWTPFWEEALGSQHVRHQGGIPTRGNHRNWIFDSFVRNKPYDLMVAELIDPAMPGHKRFPDLTINGKRMSIGYIRSDTLADTIQSAANTAQVFLGTSMKCASCHNHFLNNEWPQPRFIAFAGLFGPSDLELVRCEKKTGQIVAAAFPFDLPDAPRSAPRTLQGRLHRLAQLITDPANPRFARTIVNRLWKRYLGLGLFEPADDFRLDRPASHPELLDWLADDFMRHGYDLKHTIRLILTSHTYQHRYDPSLEDRFDVAKPSAPRYYRSPSLRRLTAEQLIDSVRIATRQQLEPRTRSYLDKISTALTRALGRPASRNEIITSRPDDVAVLQALELLNGNELNYIVYAGSLLDEIVRDVRNGAVVRTPVVSRSLGSVANHVNPRAARGAPIRRAPLAAMIDRLYWSVLSRPPSSAEKALGMWFLAVTRSSGAAPVAEPREEVWFDDELPEGAVAEGGKEDQSWLWVTRPEHPVFAGERAHTDGASDAEILQHRLRDAQAPVVVGWRDRLFAYVYIDPAKPPQEIMMQWQQVDWEHRAYWADAERSEDLPEPPNRRWMGSLPKAGGWVRLEVPAGEVGLLPDEPITGWSFDQVGGRVYWDRAGIVRVPPDALVEAFGDALWALVTSPEFQYIR